MPKSSPSAASEANTPALSQSFSTEDLQTATAFLREFRKVDPACEKLAATADVPDQAASPEKTIAPESMASALEALLAFTQDGRVSAFLDSFTVTNV